VGVFWLTEEEESMLTTFVPMDRVSSYEASPYKSRLDLIGQRLIEQRYLPVVTEQHVREWASVYYVPSETRTLPAAAQRKPNSVRPRVSAHFS
jgi:hypothetical protein